MESRGIQHYLYYDYLTTIQKISAHAGMHVRQYVYKSYLGVQVPRVLLWKYK